MKYKQTLIKRQTFSEVAFHNFLLEHGIKHNRQKVIYPYICDFYIKGKGLIIELDGEFHNKSDQIGKDSERDSYISSLGIFVLRYSNDTDFNNILKDINEFPDITEKKHLRISKRISDVNKKENKPNESIEGIQMSYALPIDIVKYGKKIVGFLRQYQPYNADIYVSRSQIELFDLQQGDLIIGTFRLRKDKERSLALLKIEEINGKDPIYYLPKRENPGD